MKSVRIALNLAVAVITILTMSVVGRPGAVAAPAHASALTVASWSVAGSKEADAVKRLLADYTAKYHVSTNYQVINGDYPTAMKARIAAGTLPDVFYLNSDVAQDFIQTGGIHNLDFLKSSKSYNFNDLYSALVKGFMWKGHVYAIPKDQSTLALWYNKDMFKAAGISKPPTSWSQIQSDACKLTNKSKKIYGISLSNDIARWWPFVYAAGGSVFNKDRTKVVIDNSGAATALQFYAGMVQKGCGALPTTMGAGWNGEAFGKGLAAMAIEGVWLATTMSGSYPNIKYGIVPLAKGPKGYGNLDFTAAWAMSAKTKNFKAASEFIEFATGKSGMATWDKVAEYLPARKSIGYPSVDKPFMQEIKYSKDYSFPPHGSAMGTTMDNDIQKVMQNQMSVSAALADMQRAGNVALSAP